MTELGINGEVNFCPLEVKRSAAALEKASTEVQASYRKTFTQEGINLTELKSLLAASSNITKKAAALVACFTKPT